MTREFTDEQAATFENLLFELRCPKTFGQPIIIEDYCYSEKDHYRVYIIWDEWGSHPDQARANIIIDAFYALKPKKARYILQCTGLTIKEAWKKGFLPFGIEPRTHREGDPPLEEYIKILLEMEASYIPEFDSPQLRFHTLSEVEAAYDYLREALPGSRWLISVMSNIGD